MSYKPIYSRPFLVQTYSMVQYRQDMIFEAAEHVCKDPTLHDYIRPYLVPFKQKHPTTDKQYALYFIENPGREIFFVWVNDDSCLHTTRANYDDPCTKKFLKLKDDNDLELYDALLHKPQFEVHPKSILPIKCRSRFLGYEVNLRSNKIDDGYEGYSFSCDDPHEKIAIRHTKLFLKELFAHIKKIKVKFKITIIKLGNEDIIEMLKSSYEPSEWNEVDDAEDFILVAL